MNKWPGMHFPSSMKTLCFFFCCLIASKSQGATGEVMVTSPVVDDINIIAVPKDQVSLAVSGTYILTEDATPNFTGPTEYCSGGIGTFQPRYWDGRDGGPVGYYAELFFRLDGGTPQYRVSSLWAWLCHWHRVRPAQHLVELFLFSFSEKPAERCAPRNPDRAYRYLFSLLQACLLVVSGIRPKALRGGDHQLLCAIFHR